MAVAPKANTLATFEIKSAALTLVAIAIKTTDLALLAAALTARFADAGSPFDQDPVAIDLSALREADAVIDFPALTALLREHRMVPIAVRGGSAAQMEAAFGAGLAEAHPHAPGVPAVRAAEPAEPAAPASAIAAPVAAAAPVADAVAAALPLPAASRRPAVVIDKPLRSGQQVYAKDADLIVLAVVSFGAEVIADGNIHVYAPLRGRALAGGSSSKRTTTSIRPRWEPPQVGRRA